MTPDGRIGSLAVTETTAIIHVSMGTLKDLYLSVGEQIRQFEAKNGEIITEYVKRQKASHK
jgi:hypothetical protein